MNKIKTGIISLILISGTVRADLVVYQSDFSQNRDGVFRANGDSVLSVGTNSAFSAGGSSSVLIFDQTANAATTRTSFAIPFSAVSLTNIGDKVSVSLQWTSYTGSPFATGTSVYMGLFDSKGTQMESDLDTSYENDRGYWMNVGINTPGQSRLAYKDKDSAYFLSPATYPVSGDGIAAAKTTDIITFNFALERTAEDNLAITAWWDNANGTGVLTQNVNPLTHGITDFDVLAFGSANGAIDFYVGNITVTTNVIPEPAAVGLLVAGAVVFLLRRRLRAV